MNSKNSSTKKLNINNCFCISVTLIKNIKLINFSSFFQNQMLFFLILIDFFLFLQSWMTWSKRSHFKQFLFFTWMIFFFDLSIQLWLFIINVFFLKSLLSLFLFFYCLSTFYWIWSFRHHDLIVLIFFLFLFFFLFFLSCLLR